MAQRTLLRTHVVRKEYVTSGMMRLALSGKDLEKFESVEVGDEFVRLFFPNADGHIELPSMAEDGSYSFSPRQTKPHTEVYTIREFDRQKSQLLIDFVVHSGGYASEWAQAAQLGDHLVLTTPPHATFRPPDGVEKIVFICDATGLPALCRMLELLPQRIHALAIVEVADARHRQPLHTAAELEVIWLDGCGNGVGPSHLADTAKRVLPGWAPGYIWMGAEQKAANSVRHFAKQSLGLSSDRLAILGYWTERSAPQHAVKADGPEMAEA